MFRIFGMLMICLGCTLVPASVDRDYRCCGQFVNRAEGVVAVLHAQALHVRGACSAQCEAHVDLFCIFFVLFVVHHARSFDGVPTGRLWVEEGAQVDS